MGAPPPPFAAPPRALPPDRSLRSLLVAPAVTVVGFAVVAVAAAVLWKYVVVLPTETKQGTGAGMDEAQLRQIFDSDGWFMMITAIAGLTLGVLVELLRRGHAVTRVVSLAVAGLLAAWLTARVGLVLGPPDPDTVLPSLADGATAPLQLVVLSRSAYLVWPFASVLGALLVLLLRPRHDEHVFAGHGDESRADGGQGYGGQGYGGAS